MMTFCEAIFEPYLRRMLNKPMMYCTSIEQAATGIAEYRTQHD